MSEWQPIETAPKDGSRILVVSPHVRSGPFIVSWWRSQAGITGFGCPNWNFYTDLTIWRPVPEPPPLAQTGGFE